MCLQHTTTYGHFVFTSKTALTIILVVVVIVVILVVNFQPTCCTQASVAKRWSDDARHVIPCWFGIGLESVQNNHKISGNSDCMEIFGDDICKLEAINYLAISVLRTVLQCASCI